MGTEEVTSLSGGMLRLASLCPRLALHKVWFPKQDLKVGAAGGHVVNGNLFHAQIVGKILKDLANADESPVLRRVMEAKWDSQEALKAELWRIFSQTYMAPVLREFAKHLGNNPREQIEAMTQGLGKLAALGAELLLQGSPDKPKTRRFLPPEGTLQETIQVEGLTVELVGNYDGLWFDDVRQEFVLIDFKCKTPSEFPSDLHQLTCYSWLIHRASGRPVRGVLIYVQPQAEVRQLSALDLAAAYPKSQEFIRHVAQLLTVKQASGVEISQTAIPNLCQRCPLDERCDGLYGQRSR